MWHDVPRECQCRMDAHSEQVQCLLAPLAGEAWQAYHTDLIDHAIRSNWDASAAKLEVRFDAGDGKGKGLFAAQPIQSGAVLFKELPLVRSLRGLLDFPQTSCSCAPAFCFFVVMHPNR